MSDMLIRIDVDSHTELLNNRAYWKAQAEQLAHAATEADEKWRQLRNADRSKYDALRAGLHTVLEVEGADLPDAHLLEVIGTEVRIARAADRPATATMDHVMVVEWPDEATRRSADQFGELLREAQAATSVRVPVEPPVQLPPNRERVVVEDFPNEQTMVDATGPNMPGLTGRRFRLGEPLDDAEPLNLVTNASAVWSLVGHEHGQPAYFNEEAGETLPLPELLARCVTLYEMQPPAEQQLVDAQEVTQ